MMRKIWLGVLGISLLLSGCSSQANGATAPKSPSVSVGSTPNHMAPGFKLQSLQGTTVSLQSLLGHHAILLNAWASWCDNCVEETPDLVRLASEYSQTLSVVGVDMTQQEVSVKDVKSFVARYGIKYPVLLDPNGDFLNSYNVVGLPTSFLLAPSGKIIAMKLGALTSSDLESWVKIAKAADESA